MLVKLMCAFGDVCNLLQDEDISPVNASKLRAILNDDPKTRKLKMELAATVDYMEPFVKATYTLEGDGFLALEAYEHLAALYNSVTSKHAPNVTAMAKEQGRGNPVQERQLQDYADACVKPAFEYFKVKFDQDLKPAMMAFKAARYFSPLNIKHIRPSLSDLNGLTVLPFFHSPMIEELKKESCLAILL